MFLEMSKIKISTPKLVNCVLFLLVNKQLHRGWGVYQKKTVDFEGENRFIFYSQNVDSVLICTLVTSVAFYAGTFPCS